MPSNLQAVVKALANQSFRAHILAKRLVDLGILQPGVLQSLIDTSPERSKFIEEFLNHMASLGVDLTQ